MRGFTCCFFLEGWETGAAWAEAEEASFYWGGCCSQLDQPKSSKLADFGGGDCCSRAGDRLAERGLRTGGLMVKAAGHQEHQGKVAGGFAQYLQGSN